MKKLINFINQKKEKEDFDKTLFKSIENKYLYKESKKLTKELFKLTNKKGKIILLSQKDEYNFEIKYYFFEYQNKYYDILGVSSSIEALLNKNNIINIEEKYILTIYREIRKKTPCFN